MRPGPQQIYSTSRQVQPHSPGQGKARLANSTFLRYNSFFRQVQLPIYFSHGFFTVTFQSLPLFLMLPRGPSSPSTFHLYSSLISFWSCLPLSLSVGRTCPFESTRLHLPHSIAQVAPANPLHINSTGHHNPWRQVQTMKASATRGKEGTTYGAKHSGRHDQ